MKTNIWNLLYLVLVLPATAAPKRVDVTKADAIASSTTRDFTKEYLTKRLSEIVASDIEKIKSIYSCVAENISHFNKIMLKVYTCTQHTNWEQE